MHAYLVFILLYFRGEKLFVAGILCCSDWTESFIPTNLLDSTINTQWRHFNDVKQMCILRCNQQCALIDDRSYFKRQRHLCVKEKSPWEMSYFQVAAISQALPCLTRHWRLNIVTLCSMFSYWQRNRRYRIQRGLWCDVSLLPKQYSGARSRELHAAVGKHAELAVTPESS